MLTLTVGKQRESRLHLGGNPSASLAGPRFDQVERILGSPSKRGEGDAPAMSPTAATLAQQSPAAAELSATCTNRAQLNLSLPVSGQVQLCAPSFHPGLRSNSIGAHKNLMNDAQQLPSTYVGCAVRSPGQVGRNARARIRFSIYFGAFGACPEIRGKNKKHFDFAA